MVAEVARSKALAVALRRVAVTDGSGQAVDLSEFIGSDAEDAAEAAEVAGAAAAPSDAATDIAAFDVYDDEVETAEDTKA